jgi:hypothetical protein
MRRTLAVVLAAALAAGAAVVGLAWREVALFRETPYGSL